ncbi:MAG: hypothetical protein LAN61_15020 [Acidobacteriia bacterium]|nr:hypothetical protein [Terriglobia bacterium]
MRLRTVLSLATLFVLCFTVAVWSLPVNTRPLLSGLASSNPTVTGKLSAIGVASLTNDVKKSQDAEPMQFLIDDNTKLEGKLTVGAQATVEYRASDNGKNVALHVVVQPVASLHEH